MLSALMCWYVFSASDLALTAFHLFTYIHEAIDASTRLAKDPCNTDCLDLGYQYCHHFEANTERITR